MSTEEYGADLVTLVDEDGKEHEFVIVDSLELQDEHYVALVANYEDPEDSLQDDGELIVLRSVYEGEEEYFESIDDEEEFDKVAALFMERLEDSYDFVDGDEEEES